MPTRTKRTPPLSHESRRAARAFRSRYLALTFGFIAVVVALILTGQFAVLTLLLLLAMIYAPRLVAWLEARQANKRPVPRPPVPSPWGER